MYFLTTSKVMTPTVLMNFDLVHRVERKTPYSCPTLFALVVVIDGALDFDFPSSTIM